MDEQTFLGRVETLKVMPDYVIDVRDYQLVKARPYPWELKAEAAYSLYFDASEEQRWQLPRLISSRYCEWAAWIACDLYLAATADQRLQLLKSPLCQCAGHSFYGIADADPRTIPSRLKARDEAYWLRIRLAAVVLAEVCSEGPSHSTTTVLLAELSNAAKVAGIDPVPYFMEIAETASPETATLIRNYVTSDIVNR